MRDIAHNGNSSLLDPVWNILDDLFASAQNRLDLFRVEAQEEKIRIFQMILLAAAVMVLGTLALATATFAIALVVWDTGSYLVLTGVIAAYTGGAWLAWRALRRRLDGAAPFSATSDELRKDRECIPR